MDYDSDDEKKKIKLPSHKILHTDIVEKKTVNKIIECLLLLNKIVQQVFLELSMIKRLLRRLKKVLIMIPSLISLQLQIVFYI